MNNTLEFIEIDKALFTEIKASQEDGISSIEVAAEFEMPIEQVNAVYSVASYKGYVANNGTDKQKREVEIVTPAQASYFTGLVSKKLEENENLKEQRAWLMEQVSYLRRSVSFLENRKSELERGINLLEKNILSGIDAMKQLEDTENMTKVSKSMLKRNN